MTVVKPDFRTRLHAQVKEAFERDIANHVLEQLHLDGDVARVWRCGRPKSSVYCFWVCASPHCLTVYGDMGEFMWMRHPDMIPFIRGSIESLSYFSEKSPATIKIREPYTGLIDEWFEEVKDRWIAGGSEWTDAEDDELNGIRNEYENYGDPADFRRAVYESDLCSDAEDVPNIEYYSFHYLWVIEGLKWFIKTLDAGLTATK